MANMKEKQGDKWLEHCKDETEGVNNKWLEERKRNLECIQERWEMGREAETKVYD